MKTRLTCINCPLGCEMDVETGPDGAILSISGNECARGPKYAKDELANPLRVVTTTIRIRGAEIGALPVKTSRPIPKKQMTAVVAALSNLRVDAPVKRGAVMLANVCGTDADVIATRTLERRENGE